MTRTRLKDRLLPSYTRGEELTNMISHIVGGGLGVLVLLICLFIAIWKHNVWGIVGSAVYGISFTQLYAISSIYHGLRPGTAKKVLQVIDHCSIYIFIAGTYTPIMLCALRPVHPGWAWSLLGVVWGIAALAATLNAIDLKKFAVFSMICYIGMGWCVLVGIKPVIEVIPAGGLWLLVLGGVIYTLGAIAYGFGKKKRYMHSVFHIFVVIGSVFQFIAILYML